MKVLESIGSNTAAGDCVHSEVGKAKALNPCKRKHPRRYSLSACSHHKIIVNSPSVVKALLGVFVVMDCTGVCHDRPR